MGTESAIMDELQAIDNQEKLETIQHEKQQYDISLTEKEKIMEQEKRLKEQEKIEFVKIIKRLNKGEIDLLEIVQMPAHKRSSE